MGPSAAITHGFAVDLVYFAVAYLHFRATSDGQVSFRFIEFRIRIRFKNTFSDHPFTLKRIGRTRFDYAADLGTPVIIAPALCKYPARGQTNGRRRKEYNKYPTC